MTGKLKKVLLPNLPYLLFAWLFDKLCQAVRLAPGLNASEKLLRIAQGFTEAFASLWLSLHPLDLLLGVAGAALVRLAVYGRRQYNRLCKGCVHPCKQSFRAVVLDCPHFQSQRVKKGMDKGGKRAK